MHFFPWRKRRSRSRFLALALAICLLAVLLIVVTAMGQLRPIMNSMATARVSNVVHRAIAEAVAETIENGTYGYNDLISLEKDNEGKITALTSNMIQFNRLQIEVAENVMQKVGSVSSSELAIPVGSLTGVALLAGRGPDLHVRILSVGSPETAFENYFTDAEIDDYYAYISEKASETSGNVTITAMVESTDQEIDSEWLGTFTDSGRLEISYRELSLSVQWSGHIATFTWTLKR